MPALILQCIHLNPKYTNICLPDDMIAVVEAW